MASKMYGNLVARAFNGEVDFDTHPVKVALLSQSYTPNQDTHQVWSDVKAAEVTGTGYTAGGATLANKTVTYDAANNVTILDGNDVTWGASTITARYAVIYDASGADDTERVLMGYVDFGMNQASTNGNFTLTWDAGGIFRFTVA